MRKLRHTFDFAFERMMQIFRRCGIYPRAWVHRRLRNRVVVVGITGSAGKTTTKDLCATMLSQFGPCESTDRSENERFNVAQTVVSIDKRHRFAVIELSASKPGYLDFTLQMTRPQIGVLTLIGRDHYSAFKSLEAIAEEKSKLIMRLPKDGVAVLNIDDPFVRGIGKRYPGRKIWVGRGKGATLRLIEARSCWPEPLMLVVEHEGGVYTVTTRLHGTQLALAVLSALGVALALDLPLQQAIDAIGLAEAPEGRMQIVPCDDGVVFVRDDWKAPHWSIDEPFAFMAAAEARRKIIIVGTVSDSNKSPLKRYPRIAVSARKAAELVVFVGPDAVKALKARTGPGDESIQAVATLKQAAAYLHAELKAGDLVLLKGSNKQDHLVRLMLDRHTPINCWVGDCGLAAFCGRCNRLFSSDHSLEAVRPQNVFGSSARSFLQRFDQSIEYAVKVARRCVIYPRAWVHRRLRNRVVVVGITGSAGKTTSKDLSATMLSQFGQCTSTTGSENERFQVAEAVLRIEGRHRFAVIEISGNKPGYLDFTLQMTRPQIGVLTLIGRDHYSAFKSLEAIAEEKSKLIMRLPKDGVAVLNIDDPFVRGIGERYPGRKIWVGRGKGATLRLIEARSCWPEPLMLVVEHEGGVYTVTTRLHGTQLALAVLSALGVALALDLPLQQAIDAIGLAEAPEGRMQIVPCDDGVVFVRDDWKAPHWSLEAPVAFMREARAERKVAIVGFISDMAGRDRVKYMRVVEEMRDAFDLLVFVGSNAHYALRAKRSETDDTLQGFADIRDAADFLRTELRAGDLVLLKGSNKADHLVRLVLDRADLPVRCWEPRCGRGAFCGSCDRLYVSSNFDDEDGQEPTVAADFEALAWRGSADAPQLIVGLGNPGAKYANTPHNLGYRVLDRFAESLGGLWEEQPEGMVCRVELDGAALVLFKPGVAINLSGDAIRRLAERFEGKIGPCTIVYDDLDLMLGGVRYKRDGGDGGHNGLRSIIEVLRSGAFGRVRVGGRRAGDSRRAVDLVLERFGATEARLVDEAIERATTVLIASLTSLPPPRRPNPQTSVGDPR